MKAILDNPATPSVLSGGMLSLTDVCSLRSPGIIHFGLGAIAKIEEVLGGWQARACVVVGGARALQAFVDEIAPRLISARLRLHYAPPVRREATVDNAEQVLRFARQVEAEVVIGIGGGSALDVAKVVAALVATDQSFAQVVGRNKVAARQVRLMCIPTTAGSGSEASPNAILLDTSARLKLAAISPQLMPDATIVDPTLARGVPADVTAEAGIDALCHCIEAVVNRLAHPMIDPIALAGVNLIATHLPTAVASPADLTARAGVALGSLFGGMCLGPVNTTAVHALSYPLQGLCEIPHGLANAVLLEHVLAFNAPVAPERCARVAVALGAPDIVDREALARDAADRVSSLLKSCRVPQRLSEMGVRRDQFDALCDGALAVKRLLDRNPRAVGRSDVMSIYQKAF